MRKNQEQQKQRREFIKNAIGDSSKASEQLRKLADQLEQCKRTTDRIGIVSDLLFLSEKTIENELYK